MATAKELFASLNSEEPHIVINSDRSVTVPDELKNIAVQYDHDIETVTFDCPRYWDGNDLSEMIFNINYVRSDKHENTYICKNVTVDSNDSNIIHFDWTISQDVTDASGTLTFIVCVKKSYVDGITSQIWHSQKCDTLTILPGLKCDQVIIPSESEYNGVQVDYDQNSETAADYIKNRPFYKESKVYNSFPDADYSNPAYVISDDNGDTDNNTTMYKISDTPIESDNFIGAVATVHGINTPSEKESITLTEDMINSEQDDEGNNLLVMIANAFFIFYSQYQVEIDETRTIIEPGVYSVVNGEINGDSIICLDSIEITLNVKQIDESFIPPLDYASKELEQRVDTLEQSALNHISGIRIDDASYLYIGSDFADSPIKYLASKKFHMTFANCSSMRKCWVYSIDDYLPISIYCMFSGCQSLEDIRISGGNLLDTCLDLSKCVNTWGAFNNCRSLNYIQKITNIGVSLDFADCPLSDETVNMLLSNLKAVSTTQTLTLKSDIVDKLTEEQVAKIPSGWILG